MSACPYVGLRPFSKEESHLFFGRENHIEDLLKRLERQQFLAVVGESGCGKSSLVKSGLIPQLEAGYLGTTGINWQFAEIQPGNAPLENLAEALSKLWSSRFTKVELYDNLRQQGAFFLHEHLARYPLPDNAKLLILCDQFEELFRYAEQRSTTSEAAAFVALLLSSSKPHTLPNGRISNGIYVVLTMRSDYLGKCASFVGLPEAINQGLYITPRLNREQLRQAIEEPALMADGKVDPALVVRLLEDAENNQDQLPLMQHVLMRLWINAPEKEHKHLSLDDYTTSGGIDNALSNHGDEIYNRLTKDQQTIAEIMFRSLCDGGEKRDARHLAKISEIAEIAGVDKKKVIEVVKKFQEERCNFLVANNELTAESTLDISHESLIRQWRKLKNWAEFEAEAAVKYKRLLDATRINAPLHYREVQTMKKWRKEISPTPSWAKRYGGNFKSAMAFLTKSEWIASARRTLPIILIYLLAVGFIYWYQDTKLQSQTLELTQEVADKERKKAAANLDIFLESTAAFFYFAETNQKTSSFANWAIEERRISDDALRALISQSENKDKQTWLDKLNENITDKEKEKILVSVGRELARKTNKLISYISFDAAKQFETSGFPAIDAIYVKENLKKRNISKEEFYALVSNDLILLSDTNQGKEVCAKIKERSSEDYYYLWCSGFAQEIADNNPKGAIESYLKFLAKQAVHKDALRALFRVASGRPDFYGDVVKTFEKAVAEIPSDNEVRYFFGKYLLNQNKREKAYGVFSEATKLNPSFANIWNEWAIDVYSQNLSQQEKLSEAAQIFEKGINFNPSDKTLLSNDLELSLVQGDMQRFERRWQAVISILTHADESYSVIYFLRYLAYPDKGCSDTVNAISQSKDILDVMWNFSTLIPKVDDLDADNKQDAKLFIKFFTTDYPSTSARNNDFESLKKELKCMMVN